jgi:hypothetical protein
MASIEWMRDRLERAARAGEVVKLTGPRSVSSPASNVVCIHGRKHFCLPCVENGAWS